MFFRSLAAVLTALGVSHADAGDLQGFSFEYQITGDRSITPFQVFDDGTVTFLQFRDPAKVPAIFVRDAEGSRLVTPEPQGNYLRIAGLVQRLELVSERKTATVVSLKKDPVPMRPALPQTAFLPTERTATAAVVPRPQQPSIAYGPAARSAAARPPPYSQMPVRAEPSAVGARPVATLQDDLDEVRGELEQLRQALDALSSRLPGAGATRAAPQRYEPDAIAPRAVPRMHHARADTAQDSVAPVSVAEREKIAALPGKQARSNGSGNGASPATTANFASESATSAAPISYGDNTRIFVFEVEPGQRLSEAVRRFVSSHRLELDWDTGGADYEIRYGFRVVGGTVDEVLFGVLSPFKLNAVTRRGNNVVAVSRAA